MSSARRELGTAVLLVLAGAFMLLASSAGTRVTGVQLQPEPLPSSPVEVSGTEAAGAAAGLAAVRVLADPASVLDVEAADVAATARPLMAGAGAVVTAVAGAVVAARGRRWAALSRRYEAPATRRVRTDEAPELWDALDRGEDPTRG